MVYRCVAIMVSLFAFTISPISLNPASCYTSDKCRHLIPAFLDFPHYRNLASMVEFFFSVLLHRPEHAFSSQDVSRASYVLNRIIMTRHEFLRKIKNSFLIPIWSSETNRYFTTTYNYHPVTKGAL